MEDYRLLKSAILLIVVTLVTPVVTYAYAVSTHQNLTENIINEYKRLNGREFTSIEKAMIMKASKEEDKLPRPLNHFYDPVHNKGLKGKYPASTQWAQNPYTQASQHKWFYSEDKKLFDGADDYSWQRAVYEYAHGDKKRGLESLGHVLHLVEDLTSVPHTRDDAHSGSWADGNSYYEDYTAGLKPSVKVTEILKANNIDEIMRGTALYTNNNFLSADTIFKNFDSPIFDTTKIQNNFLFHKGNIKLIYVKGGDNKKTGRFEVKKIKLNNKEVMQSYWEHLSYEAVESGVALMDLFFREVEQEKKTGELANMNKTYNEVKGIADALSKSRLKSLFSGVLFYSGTKKFTDSEWLGIRSAARIYGVSVKDMPHSYTAINKGPDKPLVRTKRDDTNTDGVDAHKNEGYPEEVAGSSLRTQDIELDSDFRPVTPSDENMEHISAALVALERLIHRLQDDLRQEESDDHCKDIDLSIIKNSTCLSPFEAGGFAFGGGGGLSQSVVECVPVPSNGWCGAGPPGGPGAWTFN